VKAQFAPVGGKFWTVGVKVLMVFMFAGAIGLIARFWGGLGYITNTNDAYPWGIWIGVNVAGGIGLSAGGFTTGAVAYVLNRKHFHLIIRPALLVALLGYTFVILALLTDVGRYWNLTSPLINWNLTSILFAVAMCLMISTTVLYVECIPIVAERFVGKTSYTGILSVLNRPVDSVLRFANHAVNKVMLFVVMVGIVSSCLHQSLLGALMLIAPSKVHPLWNTPMLPLLFLTSAIAVAYPVVIFEHILVMASLGRKSMMDFLAPLARFLPLLLGIYLILKMGDMLVRGTYVFLLDGTAQSNAFVVENLFGVICPFVLVLFSKVQKSPGWLFFASSLAIFGLLLNRFNVFLIAYTPPYGGLYFPSAGEVLVTLGLFSSLFFIYKLAVTYLPIQPSGKGEVTS